MKALFVLLFVSGTALADDAAMLQCRGIADVPARVKCYDAIPLGASAAAPAPATAATAAVAAAPTHEQREQAFGLATMPAPKAVEAEKTNAISTTIAGKFDGWSGNELVRLSNGQVWRIIDGSSATLSPMTNPKVTIERNFFGTYFLKIDGTNNSPKVRRIQ